MKILIIRFSSIGDLTQSLSIPTHIHSKYPQAEIHFLTKHQFIGLTKNHPHIHKTWTLPEKNNLITIFKKALEINLEKFDRVYDAHNNLRSNVFYFLISAQLKLQKPMQRFKRFLLINFKINKFDTPFSGQRDLLIPLLKWGIPFSIPPGPQLFIDSEIIQKINFLKISLKIPLNYIIVAPSAAHEFKRWPVEKWIELFDLNPSQMFVILAGLNDTFTSVFNIQKNVINLTGKTTLLESAALIQSATKIISNDTGLLHFAEQLNKPTIALMGAAPFGFPSRITTVILKKDLPCWPCSKHGQGPCVNKIYHQCMNDITASEVSDLMKKLDL